MKFQIRKLLVLVVVSQTLIAVLLLYFSSGIVQRSIKFHGHFEPQNNIVNFSRKTHAPTPAHVTSERRKLVSTQILDRKCGNISFPVHLATGDTWFAVSEGAVRVFSAYYTNTSKTVTIVGVRDQRSGVSVTCQLWFVTRGVSEITLQEVPCKLMGLPESHGRRYTATMFQCRTSTHQQPSFVSVVTHSCSPALNLIPVKETVPVARFSRRFTVCLAPLNMNYSGAYELVEWIELNRILGAEKFTVYNYSSAPNIAEVLEYYSKQGLVEIVQWHIPLVVDTWPKKTTPEIHYFGQLAMLQDCLYRNKQESEYVVNIDLDEFIIPRGQNITTWSEMIEPLHEKSDSFIFRNTFFRKEWKDTNEDFPKKKIAKAYRLVTLLKTQREALILPHGSRSKYITSTAMTYRLQVHSVQSSTGRVKLVPPEVGLLHHYRNWQRYNEPAKVKYNDSIVLTKYGNKLIDNVMKTWSMLANTSLDLNT